MGYPTERALGKQLRRRLGGFRRSNVRLRPKAAGEKMGPQGLPFPNWTFVVYRFPSRVSPTCKAKRRSPCELGTGFLIALFTYTRVGVIGSGNQVPRSMLWSGNQRVGAATDAGSDQSSTTCLQALKTSTWYYHYLGAGMLLLHFVIGASYYVGRGRLNFHEYV